VSSLVPVRLKWRHEALRLLASGDRAAYVQMMRFVAAITPHRQQELAL
jgi:hypothetical protein